MREISSTKRQPDAALLGRVAVVTGATGFLGRGHCDALSEAGAQVVIADIDETACEALAQQLSEQYGVRAVGRQLDITDAGAVQALAGEVAECFGRVDVLVNSAQLRLSALHVPFEELPVDGWRSVLDVNLTGTFLCCQAFGRLMRKQNSGSIINFGSIYGMRGPDFRIYEGTNFTTAAVYSASKAGIYGLTQYLATYWGSYGIRVNAITPGGVFNDHKDPFHAAYCARVPMGRMANLEELRGVLIFLASDASSYITGQNIPVDGGRTTW